MTFPQELLNDFSDERMFSGHLDCLDDACCRLMKSILQTTPLPRSLNCLDTWEHDQNDQILPSGGLSQAFKYRYVFANGRQ